MDRQRFARRLAEVDKRRGAGYYLTIVRYLRAAAVCPPPRALPIGKTAGQSCRQLGRGAVNQTELTSGVIEALGAEISEAFIPMAESIADVTRSIRDEETEEQE